MNDPMIDGVRNCPNSCFLSASTSADTLERGSSRIALRVESNACIAKRLTNPVVEARPLRRVEQRGALIERGGGFDQDLRRSRGGHYPNDHYISPGQLWSGLPARLLFIKLGTRSGQSDQPVPGFREFSRQEILSPSAVSRSRNSLVHTKPGETPVLFLPLKESERGHPLLGR